METDPSAAEPSLPPVAWVNTADIPVWDPTGRGPIVFHFWDSLCPASLKDLPELRGWHGRYATSGLLLYGIHRPPLSFARDLDYLERTVQRLGLRWPHSSDRPGAAWPAEPDGDRLGILLVGPDGEIHAELTPDPGDYTQFEAELRSLWRRLDPEIELPDPTSEAHERPAEGGQEAAEGPRPLRAISSEGRLLPAHAMASSGPIDHDFYLTGAWEPRGEAVVFVGPGKGQIGVRSFHGPLYAVLSPDPPRPVLAPLPLTIETPGGAPLARTLGADAFRTPGGAGLRVESPRLYHVLKPTQPVPAELALRCADPGVAFYAWIFGPCLPPDTTT